MDSLANLYETVKFDKDGDVVSIDFHYDKYIIPLTASIGLNSLTLRKLMMFCFTFYLKEKNNNKI
jgi:hypothetical protein